MSATGVMAAALLLVRVYHTSGVSVEDRGAAQREAAALLGVGMAWVNCPSGPPTAAALVPRCAEAPGPLDIVLRLESASPEAAAEPRPLGMALVSEHAGEVPVFSTVYADRVEALARNAGVDHRSILGRAIAHEIGHLLLNTTRHAARGLMRPAWSAAEIQRNVASDWVFTRRERDAMVQAVLERTARAGCPPPNTSVSLPVGTTPGCGSPLLGRVGPPRGYVQAFPGPVYHGAGRMMVVGYTSGAEFRPSGQGAERRDRGRRLWSS